MRKVHDVLRLHFGLKMPQRQIARSIQVSQSTVSEYLTRFEQSGLSWPLPEGFDDHRLQQKLFRAAADKPERMVARPLASALAHKACRDGYLVFYSRATTLFRDLAMARADGSLRNLLIRLARTDVLVVDDWAMAPLSETERRDFWEICEDRYQTRSTILTSQVPVANWHEQIGDATVADGILDRLVHNAHRIEMKGESMRKERAVKTER
jgi:hypothetical protein